MTAHVHRNSREVSESVVLAHVLRFPTAIGRFLMMDDAYFTGPRKKIWSTIRGLRRAGKPISLVGVKRAVGASDADAVLITDVDSELRIMADDAVSSADVDAAFRDLQGLVFADHTERVFGRAMTPTQLSESVAEARKYAPSEIRRPSGADLAESVIVRATAKTPSVRQTGARAFDEALGGGLTPNSVTYIGGLRGQGKSSLAVDLVEKMIRVGHRPAFVPLEQTAEEVACNLVANSANVSRNVFKIGGIGATMLDALVHCPAMKALASDQVLIREPRDINVYQFAGLCRELVAEGATHVVLDYLTLLNDSGNTRGIREKVVEATRVLKQTANDLDVPIIVLAQLNRRVEQQKREGELSRRPMLSDLNESASIEQDADNVLLIQCHEGSAISVFIEKQRTGRTSEIRGQWYRESGCYDWHIDEVARRRGEF